jgi:drug/metabolite transporter (DMT)-like permease
METLVASLIVLTNWTLPSFFDKKTLQIISPRDLTINRWIIGGIISLGILIFLGDRYDLANNKKTYPQVLMLVLLAMLSHVSYYFLLDKFDASTLMIVLNPLNILAAALIGWYMYGERFNREMWFGVVGIIGGLVFFLKGKQQIK